MSRLGLRLLGLAAVMLALASCGEEGSEARLRWSFADAPDCAAAGVRTVHVFIGPLAPDGYYDQEVQCEVGELGLSLPGLSPGPHVMVLKGLAADRVRYEITQDIVVPADGDVDLGTVTLLPL